MRVVLAGVVLLVLVSSSISIGRGLGTIPVVVDVLLCVGGSQPELWLKEGGETTWEAIPGVATPTTDERVMTFRLALPPGENAIRVRDSRGCVQVADVHLMSGHSRHIFMALPSGITINEKSLAVIGSLPFEGFRVLLVRNERVVQTAAVDDNAFYFDNVSPGSYQLRLEFQSNYIDMPLNVHGAITTKNIGLADLSSSVVH